MLGVRGAGVRVVELVGWFISRCLNILSTLRCLFNYEKLQRAVEKASQMLKCFTTTGERVEGGDGCRGSRGLG